MTIKIEIWSTNIHSLRFGNIRECVTLWKVILQSLGCPWNFITPQLNTLTWFLCQPSEMYRMNVRKLWLLHVMQSRHTCTVLQFNSNLVNSNIYLSRQVPQEDLWQLRCSISPHIYGKLPHSIIWRHTKKKKRKNNANIRYRHECEPISPILITKAHIRSSNWFWMWNEHALSLPAYVTVVQHKPYKSKRPILGLKESVTWRGFTLRVM